MPDLLAAACYLVALQEERVLGNDPVSVQLTAFKSQLAPDGTTLVATVKWPRRFVALFCGAD